MSGVLPRPVVVRDHSRLAGIYLLVLGVLVLLSFNLVGVLFIWFSDGVRERRPGFRKASLWLLALHLVAILFVIIAATVLGTERMPVRAFGVEHERPALWLVYAVGVPLLLVFGLPLWWLWQDFRRGTVNPMSGEASAG